MVRESEQREAGCVSEVEAVKREQRAAAAGFIAGKGHPGNCASVYAGKQPPEYADDRCEYTTDAERFARKLFPLPKLTRPRVVTRPSNRNVSPLHIRVIDGRMQYVYGRYFDWTVWNDFMDTKANESTVADLPIFCAAYLELIANPTEEVDPADVE